jgi:hypothetical protein
MAQKETSIVKKRVENYTWNSRQDLYTYFRREYHINKTEVNKAIYRAMKSFRLRRGKPIDPRELWEKAGSSLKKRFA